MKGWEKNRKYMGRADWHLHTSRLDGENTVDEMCEQALKNGLESVAFTEHVRKKLDYDFNTVVRDLERARKRFPGLRILTGCEAKILVDGDIDVSRDIIEECEIVIASFHGFPPERDQQIRALRTALRNPDVDIWGHPATLFSNLEATRDEMKGMIRSCIENRVLIEDSLKYPTPPEFIELANKMGAGIITNSDAHSIWDMRKIR